MKRKIMFFIVIVLVVSAGLFVWNGLLSPSEKKVALYMNQIDEISNKIKMQSFDQNNLMYDSFDDEEFTHKKDKKLKESAEKIINNVEKVNSDLLKLSESIKNDSILKKEHKEKLYEYINAHNELFDVSNERSKNILILINENAPKENILQEEKLNESYLILSGETLDLHYEIRKEILHENIRHPYEEG